MHLFNIRALILKYYEKTGYTPIRRNTCLNLGEIELPATGTRMELAYQPSSSSYKFIIGKPYCLNFISENGSSDFSVQLMSPGKKQYQLNLPETSFATTEGDYVLNRNTIVIERISETETKFSIPEANIYETINCINTPTKGFLYLFAKDNTTGNSTIGKVYGFRIYENNRLILDLVPAVRKPDLVGGFIDTITDTFYSSCGSADFKGGE